MGAVVFFFFFCGTNRVCVSVCPEGEEDEEQFAVCHEAEQALAQLLQQKQQRKTI